ncbi:MAG: nucleotidyltransferase domain-containing protein [Elusimicrobia bacterium]|nr:nucleotidyltransferase domain-containing protein [Elusimicrobiota bacterium]
MPNNKTSVREGSQTRVLRFLWSSRSEWSGREIARQTGLSAPACHETLKKLDARGLVQFRRISNLHLYTINPENYLVQNVFARIFEAEAAMPEQILTVIKKTLADHRSSDVISIVLFGSMARGTERIGSDIDLLIVVPTKEDLKKLEPRIEKLRALLFRRFSAPLSPYIQTPAELKRKHRQKLPLIQEILKDGRTVYGKDLQELLS